jgi:hypothetical protein
MRIQAAPCMLVNGRLTQVGQKFRTAISPNRYSAVFLCACGQRKILLVDNVKKATVSCGCFHAECLRQQQRTHGHTSDERSPTYIVWQSMLQRVRAKPGTKTHRDYVARGITVCDRWLMFENFLEDMGQRPGRLTLDRRDNNGNYCKENCRWATMTVQNRNTRANVCVDYRGRYVTFSEACEMAGIDREVARQRVLRGWDVVVALDTPVRKLRPRSA